MNGEDISVVPSDEKDINILESNVCDETTLSIGNTINDQDDVALCLNIVLNEENQALNNGIHLIDTDNDKVEDSIETIDNTKLQSTTKIDWLSSGKMCFKAVNPTAKIQNNYLRGCHWSPDGTCLLTNSNDNIMRIYELPRDGYDPTLNHKENSCAAMNPVLSMKEIDLIYDYCWYPFMNSNNPDTCLFASTSRKGSVRLWDAYHGVERAHIQPYDHLVEPVSAQSIAFSRDGHKLYCGFDKCHRVFDISRLSGPSERRPTLGTKSELRGIISCIATSPVNIGLYACGSYSKDAAIYHEQTGEQILEFLRADDRLGGITHVEFSPVDMHCVATGARIDGAVHVWDMRNVGCPMYSIAKRDVRTNQRIFFSFDPSGRYIITGNHSGHVSVNAIHGNSDEPTLSLSSEWEAHDDVCNGLSLHPTLPLMATASGQRRLTPPWKRASMVVSASGQDEAEESDWSSDEAHGPDSGENDLRVWAMSSREEIES